MWILCCSHRDASCISTHQMKRKKCCTINSFFFWQMNKNGWLAKILPYHRTTSTCIWHRPSNSTVSFLLCDFVWLFICYFQHFNTNNYEIDKSEGIHLSIWIRSIGTLEHHSRYRKRSRLLHGSIIQLLLAHRKHTKRLLLCWIVHMPNYNWWLWLFFSSRCLLSIVSNKLQINANCNVARWTSMWVCVWAFSFDCLKRWQLERTKRMLG